MTGWLSDLSRTRFFIILFITISALTLLAWHNRFILDDAFISFRYAYNLVQGKGLVFNEGERVEGYTNFLWTLAMSIPLFLGYDPVSFSLVAGIIFFILSLIFTFKLSSLIFNSRDMGLLTIILLGTNYTFSSYATSGLETQMQACIFVITVFILVTFLQTHDWGPLILLQFSLLLSAALLTRLDSALLVIVVLTITLYLIPTEKRVMVQKLMRISVLLVPLMIIIGGWFIWKLSYYGSILPNTFYAKAMPSITSPKKGLYYICIFMISYLLIPFPFLFLAALKTFFNKSNFKMIILSTVILLWLLYIVSVGGDFMEFRFMVPILPLLFILIVWLTFVFIQRTWIRLTLILLVLSGSLHHTLTFGKYMNTKFVETIDQLYGHVTHDKWEKIGNVLGRSFHYDQNISIATGAVGAITYYSRLRTIDWYGLNNRWIARYGDFAGTRPGHQKIPTSSYLLQQRVNIIINPFLIKTADTSKTSLIINGFQNYLLNKTSWVINDLQNFLPKIPNPDEIPSNTKIIEIPIDHNSVLYVLYLFHNPTIDEAIQENNWKVYPIVRN